MARRAFDRKLRVCSVTVRDASAGSAACSRVQHYSESQQQQLLLLAVS
jgi:hypothetical protein